MDNQLTHLVCVADGSGSGSPFTYFTTAESGTVTITFVKATVADHGTSTGWTKAMGDGQYSWASICIEDDYYVIDGNTRNETIGAIRARSGFVSVVSVPTRRSATLRRGTSRCGV